MKAVNAVKSTKTLATIATAVLASVALSGCFELDPPKPVETSAGDAVALVEAMQYVKAKNGLCFGVSTVERTASNGNRAQNTMAVVVPCDKVGLGPDSATAPAPAGSGQ